MSENNMSESLAARVLAYYEVYAPEKVGDVGAIVKKYEGREESLWRKLRQKYGEFVYDFRSESFDAEKALRNPRVRPPVVDAPLLDNISKFRYLLPVTAEAYEERVKVDEKRKEAPTQPKHEPTSLGRELLLDNIADPLRDGPFSVLWQALKERRRLKVLVRRQKSARGYCRGLLKAFDRHMNLFLIDVTETTPSHTNRRLGSLLIRGDNVILVCFEHL